MSVVLFEPHGLRDGASLIFQAGQTGSVWRVVRGVVRLDCRGGPLRLPVQLALPGDLVGVEALCGQPYQFSAEAVTSCALVEIGLYPQGAKGNAQRESLLREALLQQQRRCHDMATLRTGSVLQRLAHLLGLLGLPWQGPHGSLSGHQADAVRQALPSLRGVAELVDAQSETVCRALAQLLPPRSRKSGPVRKTAVDRGAGMRPALAWAPHGLPQGAVA